MQHVAILGEETPNQQMSSKIQLGESKKILTMRENVLKLDRKQSNFVKLPQRHCGASGNRVKFCQSRQDAPEQAIRDGNQ